MPVETLEQAIEIEVVENVGRRQGIQCPRCDSTYMRRMSRMGLLEGKILPIFGYFPWRCTGCGGSFLMKKRGQPTRRHKYSPESG